MWRRRTRKKTRKRTMRSRRGASYYCLCDNLGFIFVLGYPKTAFLRLLPYFTFKFRSEVVFHTSYTVTVNLDICQPGWLT